MSCPNCGTPTPDQAPRCPSCGTQLVTAPAQPGWAPPSGSDPPPSWGATPPPQPGWGAPQGTTPQPGWGAPEGTTPQPGWGAAGGGQAWGAPGGAPSPPPGQPYGAYPTGGPQQPQWGQPQWNNEAPGTTGQLAGWWYRVGATLIDGIMLGVVSGIVGAATGRAAEYVVGFVIGLVYTAGLLVSRGQTVGMMALGTKCINESSGGFISTGAAVGRYVLTEVLAITVIGGLLDILWPLWDAKNQTLHDKAVGSLVVRTR